MVAAFEQLVASSQSVVTKRIDLALLEAREMVERSIERVALFGVAVVLATGMWFAAAWALVSWATPDWWSQPARLAVFAAVHAVGAGVCVAVAMRQPVLPRPASLKPLGAERTAERGA